MISVVVSTFNGEKYIEEQMDSLRRQERQADEVLFFDDCSTDRTVEIVKGYIDKYQLNEWSIIVNAENKGWRKNFFDGIVTASGDLIFPCDQDDIWASEKLMLMESIMQEHSEIQVLTSNCEAFYDDGKSIIRPEPENEIIIKQPICSNLFNTKYPGCTYCIRKTLVNRVFKYWESDFPHDAFFWRMAMFSDSLYSFNKSLIRWRRHHDSTYTIESVQSKSASNKREWCEYAKRCIRAIQLFIKNESFSSELKENILAGNINWLNCRADFFDNKSLVSWIKLFRYRKYYPKFKQYFGDWFLVYLKR